MQVLNFVAEPLTSGQVLNAVGVMSNPIQHFTPTRLFNPFIFALFTVMLSIHLFLYCADIRSHSESIASLETRVDSRIQRLHITLVYIRALHQTRRFQTRC
jgi:hypothetical protein